MINTVTGRSFLTDIRHLPIAIYNNESVYKYLGKYQIYIYQVYGVPVTGNI